MYVPVWPDVVVGAVTVLLSSVVGSVKLQAPTVTPPPAQVLGTQDANWGVQAPARQDTEITPLNPVFVFEAVTELALSVAGISDEQLPYVTFFATQASGVQNVSPGL